MSEEVLTTCAHFNPVCAPEATATKAFPNNLSQIIRSCPQGGENALKHSGQGGIDFQIAAQPGKGNARDNGKFAPETHDSSGKRLSLSARPEARLSKCWWAPSPPRGYFLATVVA